MWAKNYCNNVWKTPNIVSDHEGNLIISAHFHEYVTFDDFTLYSDGPASDVLLIKIDALGNILWTKVVGDFTTNYNSHVIINNENEIYLSGDLSSSLGMIMTKIAPTGETIWELNPTESQNRNGGDLAFDYSGNLIHTGVLNGDFIVGDFIFDDNHPSWEPFILKFKGQSLDLSTSLDELLMPEYDKISISPVPSSGQLQLQVEDFTVQHLQLFSSSGQMIWQDQEAFNGTKTIDLSFLNNGFYFLQFKTKNGMVAKKIMLAK